MAKRQLAPTDQKESDKPPPKRQKISDRLIQQFQNTLQNDTFTDITFIVGPADDTLTFEANKLLFSTHSQVFNAMLFGKMAQLSPIKIPDVKPLAFDYLHKLFYMKQPQLTYDIIIHVLYAAQKYLIDIVTDECKQKLNAINNVDDVYLIFRQIEQYSPSVFEDKLINFFQNADFVTENMHEIVNDRRFNALQPFIVQNIIKTDIISSETIKYESIKKYCIKYQKDISNDYDLWQSVFKDKFIKFVKLRRLSMEYLLDNVKNDNVISSDALLEIIVEKRKIGFKLSDVLLSHPQRRSLKVGDLVDLRDLSGLWWEAKVIEKHNNTIRFKYVGYDIYGTIEKSNSQRIAKHKSVTKRNHISRPCMNNLTKKDYVYVNCAYHPTVGIFYKNTWTKMRIGEIKSHVLTFKLGNVPREELTNKYSMHADSQTECICINDKCEYCCRHL